MLRIICVALGAVSAVSAYAKDNAEFPVRPIKFISTQAAGSPSDMLARLLGDRMAKILNTPFIIENKPGAGGLIAMDAVLKSPADGYVIGLGGATTHVIYPAIRPNMPYDALKDFAYLGQVSTTPGAIVASANFPANNMTELMELAKTKQLQYASWGIGSTGHFCGEMVNLRAKTQMQHIPYKTVTQIQSDLYGGILELASVDGGSAPPMVKSGKVKVLGTCTGKHISFPNVKGFEQDGILEKGSGIGQFRYAVYTKSGTPPAIVNKLEATLKQVVEMPDVQAKMIELGQEPAFVAGAQVRDMTEKEIAYWRKVAKDANINLD